MTESEVNPNAIWYSMKLGQGFAPDNNTFISRVPGGWIFMHLRGVCFVPFNNEFMKPQEIGDAIPF